MQGSETCCGDSCVSLVNQGLAWIAALLDLIAWHVFRNPTQPEERAYLKATGLLLDG